MSNLNPGGLTRVLNYIKTWVTGLLNGKANSGHTHTKSEITDFPAYGNTAGTICQGNDSRLSGISNSDIDDIADDAGFSSGSLPASEDIFITGDIIPNTDNSVDVGASSKNIKMIYTKGITINGTQFLPSDIPTKTSDLTNDSGYITSSGSCNYANSAGSSSIATRDSGGTWISGRDNAVVKQTRHSTEDGNSWNPAVSVKTKNGNWTIGTVGYDRLQFSYDTDADYNTGTNRNIVVELNPESGRIITSGNTGNISISGYQVYVG